MELITNKENQVLRELQNQLIQTGKTPTYRTLMTNLNYKSPRSISLLVDSLIQKEYLGKKEDGSIKLLKTPENNGKQTINIPLIGAVSCGLPILAEENIEAHIPVDAELVRPPERYFLLKAKGDSMNKKGIGDGDLVLIKQQNTAKSGDIIVALIDDEATIKELIIGKDTVILKPHSTNPEHQPIILNQNFQIQGVLIKTIPFK